MSIYAKSIPQKPILEFLFYCLPQLLILKFLQWSNLIYLVLIGILLLIPKTHSTLPVIQTDIIDRSRMRIIFLVCALFILSNFKFQENSIQQKCIIEGKIDLKSLVMTSYVFNSGLVSCKASNSRKLMHMIKSAILGSIRLYSSLKQDSEIEYINIFFIICIINIVSLFGIPRYSFTLGLFLLTIYQFALLLELKNYLPPEILNFKHLYIFKDILFSIPLYSLYLMSSGLGYSIIVLKDRRWKISTYTLIATVFFVGFKYFSISATILYSAPFCLLIFIVNAIDLLLFDVFSNFFKIGDLQITQFASRIVFHVFITINIFVPIAKFMGFFESKSDITALLKTLIYLFVIFYLSFKVKKLIFDSHLKKQIEKMPIIKKLIYFRLKDKEVGEYDN